MAKILKDGEILMASDLNALTEDTGYIACTLGAAFEKNGGGPLVRRVGIGPVTLIGGITSKGLTANTIVKSVFQLPSGFRPNGGWLYVPAVSSSPASLGIFTIQADGWVNLNVPAVVGSYYLACVSYFPV